MIHEEMINMTERGTGPQSQTSVDNQWDVSMSGG